MLFVFLSVAPGEWEVNTDTAMLTDINQGWIDEDGQAVDLYDLDRGNHSVTYDISDAVQFLTSVFKRNLFSFQQGGITIVIGILFVIAGVTGQIVMRSTGIDFISFGITCVMVGYIVFNDTLLLQILTGRPDIIRVTEYMCLAFISFPTISFFSSITGEPHSKLLSGMFAVCLVNFLSQVAMTLSGLSDYYYLVYVSQIIIFVCFLIPGMPLLDNTGKS